eukprot:scaffold140_cov163-Amphora_coffeaeformis.AAC.11
MSKAGSSNDQRQRIMKVSFLLIFSIPLCRGFHALSVCRPQPECKMFHSRSRAVLSVVFDTRDMLEPSMRSFDEDDATFDSDNDDEDDKFTVESTPGSQQLIVRITENYVFGKDEREITVDDILSVIERDFRIRDVPVQIGEVVFDAATTGVEVDQSITEILSFAAYHGLPKRLTAELLDDSLGDPFTTAKKVFLKDGWNSVSFPKGLAIQLRSAGRPRFRWRPQKQKRVQEAIRAVQAAASARSPIRQLKSPKEFLAKLVQEEYSEEEYSAAEMTPRQKNNLPFFPSNLPVPKISWKRLWRAMEKSSANIKRSGKTGFLSYAIVNFCIYLFGMLWQWKQIALPQVTSTSNAMLLISRKLGRVFGTVFILSNTFKVPKLMSVAGMIPLTDRLLKRSSSKSGVSEKRLVFIFTSLLVSVWVAVLAVPVLSDFSRLRKLVQLETLFDQYAVEPVTLLTVV